MRECEGVKQHCVGYGGVGSSDVTGIILPSLTVKPGDFEGSMAAGPTEELCVSGS